LGFTYRRALASLVLISENWPVTGLHCGSSIAGSGRSRNSQWGLKRMPEAVMAIGGIVVCFFCAMISEAFTDGTGGTTLKRMGVYAVFALCGFYFFIRFVNWAWVTPIPFTH